MVSNAWSNAGSFEFLAMRFEIEKSIQMSCLAYLERMRIARPYCEILIRQFVIVCLDQCTGTHSVQDERNGNEEDCQASKEDTTPEDVEA